MAQVILGTVGGALGGGVGAAVGAALGRVADNALVNALSPARQRGPRLETLRLQSSAEGSPMACVFGRARVTGQVIWAARFREDRRTQGGGKSGPRTVDYAYSLSFAVGLSEGPIDGVGRVWADGQPLDLSGVAMRVHRGTEDQTPDPLIEAVEGAAPAYRGTAYAVFEDLPLGPFGNRPPQLSFEVFRRPRGPRPALEDRLEGVCLIPGAGEFVLATEPVLRRVGLIETAPENVHMGEGLANLVVSLDQLQAQAPNLKRVSLIVGWFGTDLRAGHCRVRPGVENRDRRTEPLEWSVAGLDRRSAHLISQRAVGEDENGEAVMGPAYGGTPDDETVRQAVRDLKARGLEVTLYPFVFMDIAPDNDLPGLDGGARQPPYPWRGRIRGRDGAEAVGDAAAIFGEADGWGLRRLASHYARIAAETGADGLLIGSEMRGLTRTRGADGGYPAVDQFRALAAECRAILGPGPALSYAADWSEYFGHQWDDEVRFHLDPLWADPNIDYVGVDWYPPLTDWRAGGGGLDAAVAQGPADPGYLAAGVAGGEGFDWHYADDADRAAQRRTPILDTAHGEHWIFRPKDLKGWWSNRHHERIQGARAGAPTAWVPGLKPIRLTEFGCAAVDRGGNAPNLFQDPKSAEDGLPPDSTGARDDAMQRRALEAILDHYALPANNPVSSVYGRPMLAAADAWCWDARPFPAFPARADVWADAGGWRAGHWLNGRLGGEASGLIAAVLRRGGLSDEDFVVEAVDGALSGYVIDRPMSVRAALEPLLTAVDARAAERDGRVAVLGPLMASLTLAVEGLALDDEAASPVRADRAQTPRPAAARVRHVDETQDYQTGSAVARGDGEGGGIDLDLPVVCGPALAEAAAWQLLARGGPREGLTVALDPLTALRLEPGDGARLSDRPGDWRVARIDLDETPTARLEPADAGAVAVPEDVWRPTPGPAVTGRPLFRLLDLPVLPGRTADERALAAAAAEPWRPMAVHAGPGRLSLTRRGTVAEPATVGRLTQALGPGRTNRWDWSQDLWARVEGRAPMGADPLAVLGGANALAVETDAGWEVIQFREARLAGGGVWRLSGLLRGQQGTEAEMAAGAAEGALVVGLDGLTRVDIGRPERGLALLALAGPDGTPPGGPRFAEADFTWRGLVNRPWSPAHLRVRAVDDGLAIHWMARARLHGDDWDGEVEPVDPPRFRVEIRAGGASLRAWEVEGAEALYAAAAVLEDFAEGPGPDARVAVAQWGPAFGWGVEATARLRATAEPGA